MKKTITILMAAVLAAMTAGARAAAWDGGDAIITEDQIINQSINVTHDATLAIKKGFTLTVNGMVSVTKNVTLTVTGGGTLIVSHGQDGGGVSAREGTVIVDGAALEATGYSHAGINVDNGSLIVKNGGKVTAVGNTGNNIAGQPGVSATGGEVIVGAVDGGELKATGGNGSSGSSGTGLGGAGITARGGSVTVQHGGVLTAAGGSGVANAQGSTEGGAGIEGYVEVCGGTVNATGGNGGEANGGKMDGGSGVDGNVAVYVGTVTAAGGSRGSDSASNGVGVTGTITGMVAEKDSAGADFGQAAEKTGSEAQYVQVTPLSLPGSGTSEEPYQISTAGQLFQFADIVNGTDNETPNAAACAVLKADIDLAGQAWTPIGKDENHIYTGTFDGTNHRISGLKVDLSGSAQFAGLFGCVGADGVVESLAVKSSVTLTTQTTAETVSLGGVVGQNDGTVRYVSWSGTVTGNGGDTDDIPEAENRIFNGGGVVGQNNGAVSQTRANGSVSVTYINSDAGGYVYAGGVVGSNTESATLEDSCSVGTVNAVQDGKRTGKAFAGGVVGNNFNENDGTVQRCYHFEGKVSASAKQQPETGAGGVVGFNTYGESLADCYWLEGTAKNGVGHGQSSQGTVTALTADQFKVQGSFPNWSFPAVWIMGPEKPELGSFVTYVGTWEACWNAMQKDGMVVLGGDITADHSSDRISDNSPLTVPAGVIVTLDLAGHTIDRDLKSPMTAGCVLKAEGKLTVGDTSEKKAGVIKGGNSETNGGGVYVGEKGVLTLMGGTVTGSKASAGGGVYAEKGGTFNISGAPQIKDSAGGGNVYLQNGQVIRVTASLDSSARIGVTTQTPPADESPVVFTSGLKNNGTADNFTSDGGYALARDDAGEAELRGKVAVVDIPGSGTKDVPYRIGTAAQMVKFANIVNGGETNAWAVLEQDIDLTGIAWTPIGSKDHPYTGTFDGRFHSITDLTVNGAYQYAGLFGRVGRAGTVEQLLLFGSVIVDSTAEGAYVGGVAGLNEGTVQDCAWSGPVNGMMECSGMDIYVGGVVGVNSSEYGGGFLYRCSAKGDIYANNKSVDGDAWGGGLAGLNRGGILDNCWSSGEVETTAYAGVPYAGGVAGGDTDGALITCCYHFRGSTYGIPGSMGQVPQDGGVVAVIRESELSCCYYLDGEDNGLGTRLDEEQFKAPNSFEEYNFTKVWIMGSERPLLRSFAVPYLDTATDPDHPAEQLCLDYTPLTAGTTTLKTGWYVVSGKVELDSRVRVSGSVDLILRDGAELIANEGITVEGANAFTVWAQSDATLPGANAGKLTATGTDGASAGIGGRYGSNGGTVTINGGTVTARCVSENGTAEGAGIGGGKYGGSGTITINGGSVTATGGNEAMAIGAGANGQSTPPILGAVRVGTVDAQGAVTWVAAGARADTCRSKDGNTVRVAPCTEHEYVNGACKWCGAATLPGSGTKDDPYRIGTAAQMVKFANIVNGGETNSWAVLEQDIDLAGIAWTPIGSKDHPYTGTFDGRFRIITDMTVYGDYETAGLFGAVGCDDDNKGVVENLTVAGSVTSNGSPFLYVGGIAGVNDGTIRDCAWTGPVTGLGTNVLRDHFSVGGVVGCNAGTVSRCSAAGDVTATGGSAYAYAGGVVGENTSAVEDCWSMGAVTATSRNKAFAGGVAGYNSGRVNDCYHFGDTGDTVTGAYGAGGVIGWNHSGSTLTACYYLDDTANKGIGKDDSGFGEGNAHSLGRDGFKDQSSFDGWRFTGDDAVWLMGDTKPELRSTAPLMGGGAQGDPYRISTASQMRLFARAVNDGATGACAVLLEDIDLQEIPWTPIGADEGHAYIGIFDGGRHTISGLSVSETLDLAGLFGMVADEGAVKDLFVSGSVSSDIIGDPNGSVPYVGGVAGWNCGRLEGCSSSVTVTGSGKWASVGGVAGSNWGTIESCSSTGSVTGGQSTFVGGVSGDNYEHAATIKNCFSTGSVTGGDAASVGGVVGYGFGSVVENCYSFGDKVEGGSGAKEGGVAGANSTSTPATVTGCYYLTGTAKGGINSADIDGAKALTADEFKDISSFYVAGAPDKTWDFENVWIMGGDRPVLRSFVTTVATWEQCWKAMQKDGTILLGGDISPASGDDSPLTVPDGVTVTLDLAGHVIDRKLANAKANGVVLRAEGQLAVIDGSSGKTGKITGGNSETNGGGVYVGEKGVLTLMGGTVTGSKASAGGGVYVETGGTFNLSGAPQIKDSAGGGNVYLQSGQVIRVTASLNSSARIGVTTDTAPTADSPVVFTSGLDGKGTSPKGTADNFASDAGFTVALNDKGEAELTATPPPEPVPALQLGPDILQTDANTPGAKLVRYGSRAWYVLAYDGKDGAGNPVQYTPDGTSTPVDLYPQGAAVLLSPGSTSTAFSSTTDKNAYNDSLLQSEIKTAGNTFTASEKAAVESRTLQGEGGNYDDSILPYDSNKIAGKTVEDAMFWPLSAAEAGAVDDGLRVVIARNQESWLRSPGMSSAYAAVLQEDGTVSRTGDNVTTAHVRAYPAFLLDLSAVCFASAATDKDGKASGAAGQSSLTAVKTDYTGTDWKLTLKDDGTITGLDGHKGFTASFDGRNGDVWTIKYNGAQGWTATKNEVISAVIVSSEGAVKYYGNLAKASAENGFTCTVNVSGKLGSTDKLYVFNEQLNGDSKTDYASALAEIKPHVHSWSYTAGTGDKANTITAKCGNPGCDIATGLTLTVSAPAGELTCDGTAKAASLNTDCDRTAFPGTYQIGYTKDGQPFTGTPVDAGTYVASVAAGEGAGAVTARVTYAIGKIAVTATAASQSWIYDGNAHANAAVTVTHGELLDGDRLVATAVGCVTNVADTAAGNNPVAPGCKVMHGEEDVTANYAITAEAGTLTIEPATINGGEEPGGGSVPEGGRSKFDVAAEYDGAGYTLDAEALLAAFRSIAPGATVKYALAEGGPYSSDPIVFKNVCATSLWYMVSADNYEDFVGEALLTVAPRNMANVFVEPIGRQPFNGAAVKPEPVVTDGEPSIIAEGDYDVSYRDNDRPGTATLVLTGRNNYTGTKEVEFDIGTAELSADIGWKYLKATGTYFARLEVACTNSLAAGVGELKFLFADRVGDDGSTLAALWDTPSRSANTNLFHYGGAEYRCVSLDAARIVAEGESVVFGVSDLDAATVSVGERTVEMYVQRRVLPEAGNAGAADVGDFVGYVCWESCGEQKAVPVVAGAMAKAVMALGRTAAGAPLPSAARLNEALAVGAAPDDGAEPYCLVSEYRIDGATMSGKAEVGMGRRDAGGGLVAAKAGSLGGNARVVLLGGDAPDGPMARICEVGVAADGSFSLPVPEGARFFRLGVEIEEVLK